LGLAKFRIFDIFQTEVNTTAHVTGEIAKALFGKSVLGRLAPNVFAACISPEFAWPTGYAEQRRASSFPLSNWKRSRFAGQFP
jgi:hypothetical protein